MSEMIERVARAMAWQNGSVWSELPQEVEEGDEDQQSYFDMARAAIEAMRAPTESMYQAAWNAEVSCSYTEAAHAWSAMIDAALT